MLMLPTTAIFKTTLPFYFTSGTGNRKVFLPDPGIPAGVSVFPSGNSFIKKLI